MTCGVGNIVEKLKNIIKKKPTRVGFVKIHICDVFEFQTFIVNMKNILLRLQSHNDLGLGAYKRLLFLNKNSL